MIAHHVNVCMFVCGGYASVCEVALGVPNNDLLVSCACQSLEGFTKTLWS